MNTAITMIETQFTAGKVGTESIVPRDVSVSSVSSSSPSKTKRKSSSLPSETVEYLKAWMMSAEHIAHPYPTEQEKMKIMEDTDIELKQLTNWFVNNRKRYWKPRIEARLQDDPLVPPGSPVKAAALIKPKELHSPTLLGSLASLVVPPTTLDLAVDGTRDLTTQMTSSLYRLGSPARAISEQSSMASETCSVASSQDQDDISAAQSTEEMSVVKTESVTVRILRPVGGHEPSLEDVTILPNVPAERVVRSYDCCLFTYKLPVDLSANRKKIQSCRDSEIVRMKKQYLKLFLDEQSVPATTKRNRVEDRVEVQTPRRKYRRVSFDLWKTACLSTDNGYDHTLPSLEEATQLFGFTNQ